MKAIMVNQVNKLYKTHLTDYICNTQDGILIFRELKLSIISVNFVMPALKLFFNTSKQHMHGFIKHVIESFY